MTTRSSSALVAVSRRLISQHGQHQHGQFTTLAARAGCSSPSTSTLLHQRPPTTIARFHAPPWPSCCCGNRNPLTGPRTPFSPRYASTKKGKPTTNKEDKPTSKKNNKKGEDQDAAVADNDVRGGSREKKGKQAREVEAVEEFDYESFVEDGAKKHIERFVKDLAGLRTGSASPALLEHILVKHKSSSLPLSQLAQITVKDQQTLIVLVNDDSLISPIEKSIRDDPTHSLSPLILTDPTGLSPRSIKVPIPRPTDETRQIMMKTAKEMGEKVKGNIRATRQGARDVLKRRYKGVYGEDEVKRIEKEIQTLIDKFSKEVDTLLQKKTKELSQ